MSARATFWAWSKIEKGLCKTPATAIVLLKLAHRADERGVCWPGHERVAQDCNLSERGVRAALIWLEKDGLMLVERRKDRSGRSNTNLYHLQIPSEFVVGEKFASRVEKFAGEGGNPAPEFKSKAINHQNACMQENEKPQTKSSPAGKRKVNGVTIWSSEPRDLETVNALIFAHGAEAVQEAAMALEQKGIEPLPSVVQKTLRVQDKNSASRAMRAALTGDLSPLSTVEKNALQLYPGGLQAFRNLPGGPSLERRWSLLLKQVKQSTDQSQ
jgi:hypothetical protein